MMIVQNSLMGIERKEGDAMQGRTQNIGKQTQQTPKHNKHKHFVFHALLQP